MKGSGERSDQAGEALGPAPSGVDHQLWGAMSSLLGEQQEPLAVFDADGTIWADDIGETHLHVLSDGGLVSPSKGHETLLHEYAHRCAEDVHDAYAWGARILAGMDEGLLIESAKEAWARHKPRLLPPMASIVRALIAAEVDVWVVSASNRWIIEAAVAELGVPAQRVIAVDLEREGGSLSNRVVEPMPNGEGKVGAIDARIGRRPTIAFGNSVHDVPMLKSATLGVCVLATGPLEPQLKPELESIRAEQRWFYLGIPHPVS